MRKFIYIGSETEKILEEKLYLPVQVTPSPEYPELQAQLKLPGEFVQAAFTSQLSGPSVHSSSSEKVKCKYEKFSFDHLLNLMKEMIKITFFLARLGWVLIFSAFNKWAIVKEKSETGQAICEEIHLYWK